MEGESKPRIESKEPTSKENKEALVREVAGIRIDELKKLKELTEKRVLVCCSGERRKIWKKMEDRVKLFQQISREFLDEAKELSKSADRKDITETIRKTNWALGAVRHSLWIRDTQIESMGRVAKKEKGLKEEIESLKDKQIEEIKEVFKVHQETRKFWRAEEFLKILKKYRKLEKERIKRKTKPLTRERAEKLDELRREIEISKKGLK